jgi:hypothetical protein
MEKGKCKGKGWGKVKGKGRGKGSEPRPTKPSCPSQMKCYKCLLKNILVSGFLKSVLLE